MNVAPVQTGPFMPDGLIRNLAVCEVAAKAALEGAATAHATAFLVISGTLHLSAASRSLRSGSTGSVFALPAGQRPTIAASARPTERHLAIPDKLRRRGDLPLFEASGARAPALTVIVAGLGPVGERLLTPFIVDGSHSVASSTRLARTLLAALRTELNQPAVASSAAVVGLLTAYLALARREFDTLSATPAPLIASAGPLTAVAEAIVAAPEQPHSLDALARQAGMSRSTFQRRFQEAFGEPPMTFVLKRRLHDAMLLLQAGDLSIKTVAARTGFGDRSHFSRAFRAAYGRDPSTVRRAEDGDLPILNLE